jgi:hypothetical protein
MEYNSGKLSKLSNEFAKGTVYKTLLMSGEENKKAIEVSNVEILPGSYIREKAFRWDKVCYVILNPDVAHSSHGHYLRNKGNKPLRVIMVQKEA